MAGFAVGPAGMGPADGPDDKVLLGGKEALVPEDDAAVEGVEVAVGEETAVERVVCTSLAKPVACEVGTSWRRTCRLTASRCRAAQSRESATRCVEYRYRRMRPLAVHLDTSSRRLAARSSSLSILGERSPNIPSMLHSLFQVALESL